MAFATEKFHLPAEHERKPPGPADNLAEGWAVLEEKKEEKALSC